MYTSDAASICSRPQCCVHHWSDRAVSTALAVIAADGVLSKSAARITNVMPFLAVPLTPERHLADYCHARHSASSEHASKQRLSRNGVWLWCVGDANNLSLIAASCAAALLLQSGSADAKVIFEKVESKKV